MVEASLVNTVQTVGILVGIAIALWQLRDIKQTRETELETRQAQLFMQIFGRHFERETRENMQFVNGIQYEDYDDFREKYGPEINPDYLKISSLATYYEGIGVFVKRNIKEIRFIYLMALIFLKIYWFLISSNKNIILSLKNIFFIWVD